MADEKWMSLSEHLDELRRRLLAMLIPWVLLVVAGFLVAGAVLELLTRPVGRLVIVAPPEAFLTTLRLAVYLGTAVASPLILYQMIAFVSPGLTRPERRLLLALLPVAFALFLAGGAFGYVIVLPFVLRFFLGFLSASLEPMISIGRYLSFVAGVVVPFAAVFELPLVIYLLARLGLVTGEGMRRRRGYAFVAILAAAAVLTPPDAVSQAIMAGPVYLLYEISIWIAGRARRLDR